MSTPDQVTLPRSRLLRRLLGVLLVELGRPLPLFRLVSLLWDHPAPATAASMVHNNVCRLRSTLAGQEGVTLHTIGREYQLIVESDHVDLYRFRRLVTEARFIDDPPMKAGKLASALSLWRGALLEGVATKAIRDTLCIPMERERADAQRAYHAAVSGVARSAARTENIGANSLSRSRHEGADGEIREAD